MADNYLEKRMDDYRSGRLGRPVSVAARRSRPGAVNELSVAFPPMRILVVSRGLSVLAAEVVRLSRSLGLATALCSEAGREAMALSQSVGARLYTTSDPSAVAADLGRHWGGVDVVMTEDEMFGSCGGRMLHLRGAEAPVDVLARFYLFMAHPDNSFFAIS